MELVGYARVSTREERQVFDRQVDALKASGCTRIFEDRGSGASSDRPGLRACTDYLRRTRELHDQLLAAGVPL
jgi:DNA invertase Pin-like site-specific DNA recombinase